MLDLSVGPLWWLDDGAPRSPAPAPLCSAELIAGKPCTAAALIGDCLSATADGGNSVATSRRPKGPSGPFLKSSRPRLRPRCSRPRERMKLTPFVVAAHSQGEKSPGLLAPLHLLCLRRSRLLVLRLTSGTLEETGVD